MDLEAYKNRIGFHKKLQVTADCLKEIHACHVLKIPFETLDVHLLKRIELNIDKIYDKVILNERGGYCYELNLLFQAFLDEIGFDCYLISARIFDKNKFGPDYDHMAIIVNLDNHWLVDVGFGDLFINPLRILPQVIQKENSKKYIIKEIGNNEYILTESLLEFQDYKVKYKFKNLSCEANLFEKQNDWKQSSPESYFVKNRICTLPTELGRLTLFNETFKIKRGNEVSKRLINDDDELDDILKNEFNIEIMSPLSKNRPYVTSN